MNKRIKVNGREYPAAATMGAYLLYEQETGCEATTIDPSDLPSLLAWLWCCVASACRRDGISFDIPLSSFADHLSLEDVSAWLLPDVSATSDAAAPSPTGKKKEKNIE